MQIEEDRKYYSLRIRPEYFNLCRYLECKAGVVQKVDVLHQEIFTYSMDQIEKNGWPFTAEGYKGERPIKNFFIDEHTKSRYAELYKTLKQQGHKLFKGDLAEGLIHIYSVNHLSLEEKKVINTEFNIII